MPQVLLGTTKEQTNCSRRSLGEQWEELGEVWLKLLSCDLDQSPSPSPPGADSKRGGVPDSLLG